MKDGSLGCTVLGVREIDRREYGVQEKIAVVVRAGCSVPVNSKGPLGTLLRTAVATNLKNALILSSILTSGHGV